MKNKDKRVLLANLAHILNACEKAGLDPKLTYDCVYTSFGYVLPVGRKGKWAVRIPKKSGSS